MEKIDIGVLVAALRAVHAGLRTNALLDFLVLLVLRDGEELSVQAVARRLSMRDKLVRYPLHRLEERGLVRRRYSDAQWWRLTSDGLTELRKMYTLVAKEVEKDGS